MTGFSTALSPVLEGRLTPPDDPRNPRAAATVAARVRLGKAARADNIDAVVALTVAVERAEASPSVLRW